MVSEEQTADLGDILGTCPIDALHMSWRPYYAAWDGSTSPRSAAMQ
ncbi:MAG: hypothetical protein HOA08_01770 [Rhodospirillaceae bacterium]|nr:hypothetical protein [Rhodospirillaceae bacterium]MBT3491828.1 hypothetical protein [Rhodospirillaceae bacterium]MBT3783116.1 hypothetical protein [Rhodospirillaceae bacterium]MBT3978112.1 hypothetical protein [Rhodospirillaceae bacterium]MBT4167740.1 hypothetical protein [Rhodospirillaceae bacterium]